MPVTFKEAKLKKGEAIRLSGRGVLAIKWSDRKDVLMFTTCHKDIDMQVAKVLKRGDKEEEVKKPYNVSLSIIR